jgi:methylenetetrahydrofolate dehydrogenase (NADP+) / methenyltetrahydrofolate cyclohydrolase
VADAVFADVADRTAKLAAAGKTVGLGTILVGDDPASKGYIAKKHEMCERYGLLSLHQEIPASARQADLLEAVARFNADPSVDAYIVQNPVPEGFDFNQAMLAMDPTKDADGLHPVNLGLLALGADGPRACTPAGIQAMLPYYEVPVAGRHVVIVGRGPTIGRPLSLLLALKAPDANAAVTVVHTGVKDWPRYTSAADIVVGAAGVPSMITPEVIRPGACVIGGGITWEGRKLLSDVDDHRGHVAAQHRRRRRATGGRVRRLR